MLPFVNSSVLCQFKSNLQEYKPTQQTRHIKPSEFSTTDNNTNDIIGVKNDEDRLAFIMLWGPHGTTSMQSTEIRQAHINRRNEMADSDKEL